MTGRRAFPQPNATLRRAPAAAASGPQAREELARVRFCRPPWERLRGLIGYAPLPPGSGMALPRCGVIHTAFVAGPIDVLFVRAGRVLRIAESLRPWRIAGCRGARLTVELPAGSARRLGLRAGDAVELWLD